MLVGVVVLALCAGAKPHDYTWTELTKNAVRAYRPQKTRSAFIHELGKPKFAITHADDNQIGNALSPGDVVLVWDNGDRCIPVIIGFRAERAVGGMLGIDCTPGVTAAFKANWKKLGWVTARCIHADRRDLCREAHPSVKKSPAVAAP